ncbi:MAG: CrcB family protein [Sporichthyaceae bacterium]|nr:CrcB family protein [Sporichthyaceae bacterium]
MVTRVRISAARSRDGIRGVFRSAGGASWPVLAVISAGGALGALARYGLAVAFPARPGGFPWSTLAW